jgi:hypothetical protein
MERPAAPVADIAAIVEGRAGRAGGQPSTTGSSHAHVLLALPAGLAWEIAKQLAATSIPDPASAVLSSAGLTGERFATGCRNALMTFAGLVGAASTTSEEVAAPVADVAAELVLAGAAGQGRTNRWLRRAEVVAAGPAGRAIAALERAARAVADQAAIGAARNLARNQRSRIHG